MAYFPNEIITIILSYVPVITILHCRSVCKTWRAIVDNPQFPGLHLKASGNKRSSSLIFMRSISSEIWTAVENENVPGTFETRKYDFLCGKVIELYAKPPVNGILFVYTSNVYQVSEGNWFSMYICNPATRESIKLPNFDVDQYSKGGILVSGFGYDEVSKEFKVVAILNYRNDMADQFEVQIYTLGSNLWRKVGRVLDMRVISESSAFLNGTLHWLSKERLIGDYSSFSVIIVSFDVTTEEFSTIPCPNIRYCRERPKFFQIVVLGGCLSVVDPFHEDHLEIWILKDYYAAESWTRYDVKIYDLNGFWSTTLEPISFKENGNIVLLFGSELIQYGIETGNYTSSKFEGGAYFNQGFSYVESLIPLKSTAQ